MRIHIYVQVHFYLGHAHNLTSQVILSQIVKTALP